MLEKKTAKAFLSAESAARRVEDITGKSFLPSINELRHAGFHIAQSMINETDENRKKDELRKAHSHCIRAWKDAYEFGTIYLLEQIDAIIQGYRGKWKQLKKSLPEVSIYLEKIQQIKAALVKLKTGEEIDIGKYELLFLELCKLHNKLYALAPLAETAVAEAKLDRLSRIRSATAIIIGGISLLVALLSIFMRVN